MRPQAFSYLRMSTEEQLKGDSLRRQKAASTAYAEKHNLNLINSLKDIGVSAFRGKNRKCGALKKFLDLVDNGKIPCGSFLLIESLDRLSRERVTEPLGLLLQLISKGITVVTLSDNKTYHNNVEPSDLMYSLMIMMRAHEESEIKSFRSREAWKNKRANMLKKPMTANCPGWLRLNKKSEQFEVIPERVEVIQRIFEMTLSGIGRNTIARILNEEGIPTFSKKGKGWYGGTIQKIRHNVAVMGYYPVDGTKLVGRSPDESTKGYYPQIISEDIFYQAQRAVKGITHKAGNKGKYFSNLFQGLAFCSECGAPMRMFSKGPNKAKSYLCSNVHIGMECKNRLRHNVTLIENKFFNASIPINYNYFDDKPSRKKLALTKLDRLEHGIKTKEQQINQILELGISDVDAVRAKIRSLNDDIQRMKLELIEADKELQKSELSPLEAFNITQELIKKLEAVKDNRASTYAIRASINQQLHLSIRKILFYPNRDVRVYISNTACIIFKYRKGHLMHGAYLYY